MTNVVSPAFENFHAYEEVAQSLYEDVCAHQPLATKLESLGVEGGVIAVAGPYGDILGVLRFGEMPASGNAGEVLEAAIAAAKEVPFGALSSRDVPHRCEPGALRGFHHTLSCRLAGFRAGKLSPGDRALLADLSELFVLAFCLRLRKDCEIKEMTRDMVVGFLHRYTSPHAALFDPFLEDCRMVPA